MDSQSSSGQTQARVLRAFTCLYLIKSDWAGSLILSFGLDDAGITLPVAANIAGAVTLCIDSSPDHLRQVVRSGACDFVVNTLDEAVRTMKNEIRKRTPLSVALSASPVTILPEILERGLVPQLFTSFTSMPGHEGLLTIACELFASHGARLVDFEAQEDFLPKRYFTSAANLIDQMLASHGWELHTEIFATVADLRAFDTRALTMLPAEDRLRRRWIEAAPRILQRTQPPQRTLWLTPHERNELRLHT